MQVNQGAGPRPHMRPAEAPRPRHHPLCPEGSLLSTVFSVPCTGDLAVSSGGLDHDMRPRKAAQPLPGQWDQGVFYPTTIPRAPEETQTLLHPRKVPPQHPLIPALIAPALRCCTPGPALSNTMTPGPALKPQYQGALILFPCHQLHKPPCCHPSPRTGPHVPLTSRPG